MHPTSTLARMYKQFDAQFLKRLERKVERAARAILERRRKRDRKPARAKKPGSGLKHDARDVACPACGEEPGWECARVVPALHRERLLAYIVALQQQVARLEEKAAKP